MIIMIIIPLGGCPKSCNNEKMHYFDCSRGPLLTFMIPLLQVFWQDPQYTLNESQSIAKECQAISMSRNLGQEATSQNGWIWIPAPFFRLLGVLSHQHFTLQGTNISCPMEKDPIIFPSTLGVDGFPWNPGGRPSFWWLLWQRLWCNTSQGQRVGGGGVWSPSLVTYMLRNVGAYVGGEDWWSIWNPRLFHRNDFLPPW